MPHLVSVTHPDLVQAVSRELEWPILPVNVSEFASGELRVRLSAALESSEIFVVHGTHKPVNKHMVLFGNLLDALWGAGAKRIVAICPWLGYSLQTRRFSEGESDAFSVALRMMHAVPWSEAWVIDPHDASALKQPWKSMSVWPMFADDMEEKGRLEKAVVVSPDKGSEARAKEFARLVNRPFVCLQKRRNDSGLLDEVSMMPEDRAVIQGNDAVLVDDVINSGSTIAAAANTLKREGAGRVFAYATHGLFTGDAEKKLLQSQIDETVVTDTIPTAVEVSQKQIRVLTIAGVLMRQFPELSEE